MMLKGKRILLGIGGGIAVYRAVELLRLLKKQGATVRCVMTSAAQAFVTPLTFEALSEEKVHVDLFDLTEEHGMGHIQLVRWADVVVLAPVTASLLAKMAHGVADDLLTTLMMACEKPVLLAPAMNVSMWENQVTRANVEVLAQRGFHLLSPASGMLACGEQGAGRLAEPDAILQAVLPLLAEQVLTGQKWVVNAGPTVEAWDAVRVLTNRATGKLGAALANVAAIHGAEVILVAGRGTPKTGGAVKRVDIESAAEMLVACEQHAADVDVFVGTAAVSDYRFAVTQAGKLKRMHAEVVQPHMVMNTDIVAHIADMKRRPRQVVAFAAESSDHVAYAKQKMMKKGVDAIVANDVSHMGSRVAGGWWVTADEVVMIEPVGKENFAAILLQHIAALPS